MKIIGVVGKSGSGKSFFSKLLAQKLNCKCIDVDIIEHESSSDPEILPKLCNIFGREILNSDNSLNRKKLGNIVFDNSEKMQKLIDLTYSYIKSRIETIISSCNEEDKYLIIDWAMLPLSDFWNMCDIKILVISNYSTRKQKIIERDNITEEYFNKRENSSLSYNTNEINYIFENDYKIETLNLFIDNLKNFL